MKTEATENNKFKNLIEKKLAKERIHKEKPSKNVK